MKKLIAEVWTHPQGFLSAVFHCQDNDGQLDLATTQTLLSIIEESVPPSDAGLEALVAQAEVGRYTARDPSLPDWSVNDKNVWVVAPIARPGHLCISNENTGQYSTEEGGQPQQFTYKQFRAALKHWQDFRELVTRVGKENLVGRRYEAAFPE